MNQKGAAYALPRALLLHKSCRGGTRLPWILFFFDSPSEKKYFSCIHFYYSKTSSNSESSLKLGVGMDEIFDNSIGVFEILRFVNALVLHINIGAVALMLIPVRVKEIKVCFTRTNHCFV